MQSYQWPTDDMTSDPPQWIRDAVQHREIRISDGYATVYTPTDNATAKPGDYIVQGADNSLHVVSAELYAVLREKSEPDAPLVATLGAPPFSSAVLARSAKAREAQAEYEKNMLAKLNAGIAADAAANPKPDAHNAQVEGADTPG